MPQPLPEKFDFIPKVLFTDFDDTLTWKGEMPQLALAALYRMRASGILVVPVTGACAGWCDYMIRTLPILAVIGEGGSFWFSDDAAIANFIKTSIIQTGVRYVNSHFVTPAPQREQDQARLKAVSQQLMREFVQLKFARDQDFRLTDVAFDIDQQQHVEPEIIQAAQDFLTAHNVKCKPSSIHLNAWIGDYQKGSTAELFLEHVGITKNRCICVGDSLNDDSMFASFETSVAVANASAFLPKFTHPPKYICAQNGGHGFSEFAKVLLQTL